MKLLSMKMLALALCACVLIEESFAQRPRIRRPGGTRRPRGSRRPRPRTRRPRTTQAPLNCPPIPHIDNGQGLDTGSTVRYACEPGYVLEGTNVITCINGRWTVAPRCRRQLCPRPANIPFADPPVFSNGGVSATYTCIAGYRIQGGNGVTSTTVNCNVQSQFWPTLPVCEPVQGTGCSGPPSILNALSTVNGNTATYTCVAGYRLRQGTPSQIRCNGLRWPTTGLPICDPIGPVDRCTKAPPCGDTTITREAAGDAYAIGEKVSYTCITGYRIVGSNDNSNNTANVYCQADGTWTVTPTCEPVNCGVPPPGTNTIPVVATSIVFPNSYTYVCLTNFESGSSLESKCLADGTWSLTPAPTCTQKLCPMSALPTLANADFLPQNVPIGNTVTYTCKSDYRLAPASPSSTNRIQTVTCQVDGTFTALAQTCVYVRPESCRDYFARDNLFTAATVGCVTITIDPEGPGISDPNNPDPFTVQCCKTSATEYCTQVSPNTGASTATTAASEPCIGTAPDVLLPTTTLNAAMSGRCDATVAVGYPISNAQIVDMISSTSGSCSQATNINCAAGADSLGVAVRVNGEPSGVMYGTSAFIIGNNLGVGNFAYTNGACDCGRTQVAANPIGVNACASTCRCTLAGQVGPAATSDTITKSLVTPNPAYVTHYQILQHRRGAANPVLANHMAVSIGPIQCCETF